MTRIIAGTAKGQRLDVPAGGTRPTADRVRESLFSRLENWGVIEGSRVLDLYAGSGALALEALSRGARRATLVESAPKAARVAKQNAQKLGFGKQTEVRPQTVTTFLTASQATFDLVFLDPPYDLGEDDLTHVLELLAPRLDVEATVVIERDVRSPQPTLPKALSLINGRSWGQAAAWFVRVEGSNT